MNTLQTFVRANAAKVDDPTAQAWMQNWTNPFHADHSGYLVTEGADEHFGLGQRFAARYNDLIGSEGYDPTKTTFQNTQVERAAVSGQSFAAGLYNQQGELPNRASPIYAYNDPKKADPTLRPFDMCPTYLAQSYISGNNSDFTTWIMQQVMPRLPRLSKFFGATVDLQLYKAIHTACSYEYAVFNVTQHFCSILQEDDFKVWEYAGDIDRYYTRSYGLPIAVEIGAPLLQNLVKTMNTKFNALSSPSDATATSTSSTYFRFAHAETMEPILSILGMYKDPEPLRANWTWPQIEARQFRGSLIFPFASNLYMHGYDCSESSGLPDRFLIKMQHNERDVLIPGCSAQGDISPFCGFSEFQRAYASELSINFTNICFPPTPTAPPQASIPVPLNPPHQPTLAAPVPNQIATFHAIYIWGPVVIMTTFALAFVGGFCIGSHRPLVQPRSEPLLSGSENGY